MKIKLNGKESFGMSACAINIGKYATNNDTTKQTLNEGNNVDVTLLQKSDMKGKTK